MSQLNKSINALLCLHEDLNLEISVLSLVALDYLVSTQELTIETNGLSGIYGYTDEQLDSCYSELTYYGYITMGLYNISITNKSKKLFKGSTTRLSVQERNLHEKTFEVFWKAYPIRVGKKQAKKEWMKLRPKKELVDKIMSALATQIKWKASEERRGRFVPEFQHAERWIKHARYDDEYVGGTNYLPPRRNTPQRDER